MSNFSYQYPIGTLRQVYELRYLCERFVSRNL